MRRHALRSPIDGLPELKESVESKRSEIIKSHWIGPDRPGYGSPVQKEPEATDGLVNRVREAYRAESPGQQIRQGTVVSHLRRSLHYTPKSQPFGRQGSLRTGLAYLRPSGCQLRNPGGNSGIQNCDQSAWIKE